MALILFSFPTLREIGNDVRPVNLRLSTLFALIILLTTGCTISPPRQRGYVADVRVEEAGVRLLRSGMTVCLIRTESPRVEDWRLINGNTEIVVKTRGDRGLATVERFDTRTGIRKDRIVAVEIKEGQPDWAEGFEE
jgi:hypothetical protein